MTDMSDVVRRGPRKSPKVRPPGARGRSAGGICHQRCAAPPHRVDHPAGRLGARRRVGQAGRPGRGASVPSGNGLGQAVLWLGVLGFLGLGLWQVADTAFGHPGDDKDAWGGRAKAVSKAVVYLALAWTAFGFARGKSEQQQQQSVDFTASLLDKPGGRCWSASSGSSSSASAATTSTRAPRRRSSRTSRPPRHLGDPRGADRLHRQGGGPGDRRASCSPPPACTSNAKESTGLDGALHPEGAALRPGTAQPWWPSASRPSACTASPGPGTPGSDAAGPPGSDPRGHGPTRHTAGGTQKGGEDTSPPFCWGHAAVAPRGARG